MIAVLASFFGAALSAMGMGGGGILLLYLVLYERMDQVAAQGINLVFFIPIAAVSLLLHAKNKLVVWKQVWLSALCGLPGVFLGAWLAKSIDSSHLTKMFGGFLLLIGVREIVTSFRKES